MKRERHTYLTLQTVEAARQGWLDRISAEGRELATERVPLSAALHRVLAEPVAARRSSPAFHGAAMDGIAVNAESTFTASTRRPLRLTIGTDAFWINTGHPLPEGTNAVVMVENVNTEPDGQHVVIEKAAFPWQHVRKLGEDMVASEIILPPGVCIGPYELGALAAGGVLEPLQANPTIIEDNCFIGARSEVVEGVIVEEGSVISMGVYIGQSTRIYDRETGEIHYGRVPAGSVVVSGNLPSKDGKYSLYCAVIVKKVDAKTRGKVGINELLRTID